MHELGHSLGLQHGGDEETNKKPNYLSVIELCLPGLRRPTEPKRGPAGRM